MTSVLWKDLGVFTVRFGSVFIKKSNQTDFFFLKKKNRTETGSNRPVSVRFGSVFREKTGSNRFGSVFPVWLGFGSVFRFDSVFSVWLGFFRFGSARFGFSGSRLKKPKPNRSVFSKF